MKKSISFKTNYGWISATSIDNKITSIFFGKLKIQKNSLVLNKFKKQILNYFSKKNHNFNFELQILGTNLQKKIWKQIKKIPFGKTQTYKYIANKVKTSPRYVGNVCGQNNHLIVIPCHRIVRSDGNLGGFSGLGGIKLKKKLLNLEL